MSFSDVKLEGYNQPDLEKVTIEASCVTGFEGAAADEVEKKINGENIIEIMGRVLFDVPISDIKKVLELRTVDNIWVIHGATIGKLKRKRINFAKVKVPVKSQNFCDFRSGPNSNRRREHWKID